MTRYIDAEKLERLIEAHRTAYCHKDDILAAIANQTAADVVPAVPVEPIAIKVPLGAQALVGAVKFGQHTTVYRCGNCSEFIPRYAKFCPECGAKVRWRKETESDGTDIQ